MVFRLPPKRRWSATPPTTGSETFLAAALPRFPPRVPSQWERRPGRGEGEKARRRSRPAFAGLDGRRHTQSERETDSRAGDGVSEPVPGWREQACGTLHWSWSTLQSLGYDPLSLPLSDCNHGDEGAKGPALRPLIFSSPSLALSLPLTLAPCARDFSGLSCLRNPCGIDDPSVWSSLSLSVSLAPLLAWLD